MGGGFYLQLLVPFILQDIVVAFYQPDGEIGKIVAPFLKQVELFIGMAVKHIAHYDELAGLEVLQLAYEALEVFFVYRLRHRDARFPEMACFAKMQIGYDKGLFLFPEYHALRRKPVTLLLQLI